MNLIQQAAAVEMAAEDVASMKPMELGYPAPCVVSEPELGVFRAPVHHIVWLRSLLHKPKQARV